MRSLAFVALALASLAGCKFQTTEQFVNGQLGADVGFQATATAVGHAATAYHTVADTPIDELRSEHGQSNAADAVGKARDAFRSAQTYRVNDSRNYLTVSGVSLTDLSDSEQAKVLISGTGAYLRVSLLDDRLTLLGLQTPRGREVLTFGPGMEPRVTDDFRPFMLGDSVDMDDILLRVRRGDLNH